MANPPGQNLLVIERILRDREGIWWQINDERDLRGLTLQMLTSSAVSLAIFGLVLGASNGFWQALSSMVKLPCSSWPRSPSAYRPCTYSIWSSAPGCR